MLIALAFLAITDLVVGVSNDAVNFLNSAIGSKVVSFKTIMIVASLGVAIGAIFSSGLMEVARKGIFNPEQFVFAEIIIIFMAVMITDILLLDFFNTVGMPTSTTVSIVFELLGAAVAMALIKIYAVDGDFGDVIEYINTSKATQIIFGILLSVFVAFTIGAIVQWFARVLLSYNIDAKATWVGALFGGLALTAITYFIFMKGIKGTPFASKTFAFTDGLTIKDYLEAHVSAIVAISLGVWFVVSYIIMTIFKTNIYKIVILVGTFALALAFAGNDLVNFIGVPIAAYQSFQEWVGSGIPADQFTMEALSKPVETPTLFLVLAGLIMVTTLWFSSKAKSVVQTSIDLSSQEETKERFEPNWLSRGFVRLAINMNKMYTNLIPLNWQRDINLQFQKPFDAAIKLKPVKDRPAFDMVRAAVNLMVASVLISIATSMKLPLSTTYVTFMVAMGTSLADRAWGAESAVYRVAGVLNVIGGWFFTAFIAFTAAALIVCLINIHVFAMVTLLLIIAIVLIVRNSISHARRNKEAQAEDKLMRAESSSIQGVIHESAQNIANVIRRGNRIYTKAIDGLAKQNLTQLKKNKKQVNVLLDEIDDLKDNIFYFIKNLDDSSVGASNFYLSVLDHLQDMTQSLNYISRASHKHVNNNHRKLKFSQIKELQDLDINFETLFNQTTQAFSTQSFEEIGVLLNNKQNMYDLVQDKIQKQVERTRSEESSPKNTSLYFSLLLESKDLLDSMYDILEEYYASHDSSVKPARMNPTEEQN